jgi:hypothetical protein
VQASRATMATSNGATTSPDLTEPY